MGKNIVIPGADFSNSVEKKSFSVTDITSSATLSRVGTQFTSYAGSDRNFVYAMFQYSSSIKYQLVIIDVEQYRGKTLRELASYRDTASYADVTWWKAFAISLNVANPYTSSANTANGARICRFCETPAVPNDGTVVREWRIPDNAKYFISANNPTKCPNPKWWIVDN